MSDQIPSKPQTSRTTADPRNELSEEVFAWVVSDTSELPEIQTEGSHAAPEGAEQSGGGSGNRQLLVSAPALARHMGLELPEPHSEPGRRGAEPGSDWLASSGLAPLPAGQFRGLVAGEPSFTHTLPSMGSNQNVGHAIIPIASNGSGAQASGQTPGHVVTGGQPNGPAIAGFIPSAKEGNPVPILISVVNGNNTKGGSTVTIGGLPPGTTMNQGHAGQGGTWILGPGTDLKTLTMTPPTDWFGSGHIAATVVDPNGHSAQIQMPFTVQPQPDAARITGTDSGTASEDQVLSVSGALTVVDPDPGEAHFHAAALTGSYGRLQIDPSGHWTYVLDNSSPSVQALVSGQSEHETFTIHSVDGTSHQLVVNVMGTDDKATISGTAVGAVTEDKLATTGGKLDVTDPDAGQAGFVPQTGAAGAHGSFTVQPDGTWSYTLDNGQPAVQALKTGDQITDTLTVSTVDGSTKQITVTINGTDDKAAISGTAVGAVTEDKLATTGGKLDVTDPDAGQAGFVPQTGAAGAHGSFTVQPDGTWSYTLDNGQPAVQALKTGDQITDTLTVSTLDGTTKQITVTINGTDDKAAISGTAVGAVTEDKLATTGGKLDVTDPDAGQAGFVPQTGAAGAHGSFTVQPDGTWSYTLDTGQPAVQALKTGDKITDTLTVSTVDGTTKQITVTINGTDDKAIIGGVDTGSVTENTAGVDKSPDQHQPGMSTLAQETIKASGTLTIIDADAGEASFDTHGPGYAYHGAYGDLLLRQNGEWFYSADVGSSRFFDGRPTTRGTAIDQLGEGQTLTDTITVYSKDGTAHDITITIHGSNDAPYCASEVTLAPGTEDTAQTLTKAQLLANTVEVDANDAGKLSIAGLRADHGSIRDNGDGTYTFTPARDYNGAVHFTYDVKDAHGGVTHTGATTTLVAVSDAAIIGGTDTGSATEDRVKGRIVISGLLTVSDPDGPSQEHFQYSQFGEHAVSDPFGGNLHIDSAGSWSYVTDNSNPAVQQLAAGQEGHATYRVRSADGTTHQIQITIHGTNDTPVLSAATASATEDGSSVTGQMSATDVDTGDTLTYALGQAAPAGFALNPDGSWTFDPTDAAYQHLAAGATEQVTIPVTVTDGTDTDTQNLVITVTGTNDGPAVSSPVTLPGGTEDKAVQITAAQLLDHATDVDTGDQLSVTGLTASHGTITGDAATGFTFTPDANYNGPVALSYQVTDGHGGTVAQTASMTLSAVGDPAIITDVKIPSVTEDRGYINTHYELQVYGKLDITDPDPGEASFDPNIGSQTYQGIGYNSRLGGHVLLQRDGNFIYYIDNRLQAVQQLGAGQTATDTTTIRSVDGTTHQIQITIHGTNDTPVLSAATASATEDGSSVTGQMSATDVDTGDTLTYALGQAAPAGFALNPDGSWTFDPTDAAYQHLAAGATEQVTIPVTVTDGTDTDTQNLVITVTGTNDAAVYSGSTTGSITEDSLSRSGKLETAWHNVDVTDPDTGEGQVVAIEVGGVLHQLPANFASTVQGTYGSFHTTHGTDGHDKWMYFADNGNPAIQGLKTGENLGETAVLVTQDGTRVPISVTIHGHEDGVIIDTPASTAGWLGEVVEDSKTQVSGQLQAHDTDTHDSVSFTPQTTTNAYGTFTVDASGHWAFALDNNAVQNMRAGQRHAMGFDVEAVSSDGSKATQHIEIFARGTNDAPVLSALTASATEGGQRVTGQMSATDVDTGDTQRFSIAQPVDGFTLNQDGSWSFDPTDAAYQNIPDGQTRDVTIAVTVTDKAGDTDTRNLVITVTGTNDSARIAGVDTGSVTEDVGPGHHTTLAVISTSGTLTISDTDAGEAAFTPVGGTAGAGTYGSFTLDAQGNWTYAADNRQAAVQNLGPGQTLTDTLTVHSVDGTAHNITVTINGAIDTPSVGASVGASHSAPGHATAFVAGNSEHAPTTLRGLTLHAFAAGQAYETPAGKLADLTTATATTGTNQGGLGINAPEPAGATGVHQTSASGSSIDSRMVDPTDHKVQQGETLVISFAGITHQALITLKDFGGQGDRVSWTAYAPDGTPLDHGDLAATSATNPSGMADLTVQTTKPFAYVALHAETPPSVPAKTGTAQFTTNVQVQSVRAELVRFTTPLTLQGAIGDTGDPDQTVSWRIEGLQQAELSAGTLNADGSWTVTRAEAAGLQVLHSDVQHLTITAIATDAGTGDTARSAGVPVTVDPAGATYTVITGSPVIRTDEDRVAPITGDLDIDTNLGTAPTFVSGDTATQYGRFHIDADGQWNFTVDTAKAQELIGSGVREQITVRTTNGATLDMDIEIKGQNDPGVMVDLAGSGVRGPAAVVGGHLQITDIDDHNPKNMFVPSFGGRPSRSADVVGQFGTLHLDRDSGIWTYTVDPAKAATIPAGETRTEDFTALGLQLSGGGRHSLTLRVEVEPSGSAQALQSVTAQDSGDVTEDQTASGTQNLVATGDLSGVTSSDPLPTAPIAGTHGTFTTTADGHWTYTADNTDATIQGLKTGETLTDEMIVKTSGGQAYRVAITIHGTDDIAQIGGAVTGTVTEDVGPGHHTNLATISTSGDLTITDADAGEAAFQVQTGVVGTYGTFNVDAVGHWTYQANNAQTAIQSLRHNSAPLTDTFTVTSKDGTHHDVTISIHGTNDAPLAVSQQGAVTEGATQTGHLSVLDVDAGDTHRFTTTANVPGFVLNSDGTYTFDASGADYQGLKEGEVKPIDIPVTITDSEGLTDSFTFHWAVTGTNDAPRLTVSVPRLSTPEDTPITIHLSDLHYSDPDGDLLDHLTILDVPYASQGMLMLNGVQVAPNTQVSAADLKAGHLVFQPATDVHRTDTYFRFTTNDGHTDSNPARANIDITPVNDAPTASAGDLGQTTQNTPRTFTDSELLQTVHGADVDTGDTLSIQSVQVDPSYGSFARHGAGQWIFTPAVGAHHDDVPVTVVIQDRAGATANATATLDIVQTYRPPDLAVHVDIGSGRTIPAPGSGSSSSNSFQGGYNHHLDQMMQQLQRDQGGHIVRHVHDEIKGSERSDRVFILDNMRDEEINMEKGSDLFYLRGTTHEKIEGKEGMDTLILGSYDSSRHGPHSWRHIPEIKGVENIMTNDGVWVIGGPPRGFDARYFQANPPTPPPHHAYDVVIRVTDHVTGNHVTGIRITGLAAGLTLLDHAGHPISQSRDGSYKVDPAHTDVTLVSDHDLRGHPPGFETVVTTENSAMGMQTVTTQHSNGHVDHVDTPLVSHDEPVDDGTLTATVTVEFDFVEDSSTETVPEEGSATLQGAEDTREPNDPEGLADNNRQTNPYLAAIGAHAPSGDAMVEHDNGQGSHYLDALGVAGSASNDETPLDPATFDDPESSIEPHPDVSSDHAEADVPIDDPIVPLPEDDDPSSNSG